MSYDDNDNPEPDQPRPDELDQRHLQDLLIGINEDPDFLDEWERGFIRSVARQTTWSEKQCKCFDRIVYKQEPK